MNCQKWMVKIVLLKNLPRKIWWFLTKSRHLLTQSSTWTIKTSSINLQYSGMKNHKKRTIFRLWMPKIIVCRSNKEVCRELAQLLAKDLLAANNRVQVSIPKRGFLREMADLKQKFQSKSTSKAIQIMQTLLINTRLSQILLDTFRKSLKR